MPKLKTILLVTLAFLFQTGLDQPTEAQTKDDYARQRAHMVEVAVKGAGVTDERVLKVMLDTPRHEFLPSKLRKTQSYLDAGVPIGEGQTISSPFIVAYMTQMLDPKPTDKVLEIGTGSGYQAAILAPLVKEVYSIEIVESLGKQAARVLKKLEYVNIFTKIGDGYQGWAEHAPFDKIIVTCSPEDIPKPLVDQLKEGGLIVVPIGERHQQTLYLMEKKDGEMVRKALQPTLFVPMTGTAEDQRKVKPDPTKPQLINGDFEQPLNEKGFVPGWYYERQLTWMTDPSSPSGQHYVQFQTDVPGQLAHLMQSFEIDGNHVASVKFSATFAGENVAKGPGQSDYPATLLSFYNNDKEELGSAVIGPFKGTQEWKTVTQSVRVPRTATHAFVRIGLFGAVGVAKFDNLSVSVDKLVEKKSKDEKKVENPEDKKADDEKKQDEKKQDKAGEKK